MLLNDIYQKHPDEKTVFIFKDEFTTYFGPDADSTFRLDHCFVTTERFANATAGFNHCIFNLDPFFADPANNDLHIDSIASPVIGTGNPIFGNEVPYDLDGVSRIGAPDMGAFQFINR